MSEEVKGSKYTIYTDGAFIQQTKRLSSAYLILTSDKYLATDYKRINLRVANIHIAEIYAVCMALEKLRSIIGNVEPGTYIKVLIDNANVVRHLQFKTGIIDTLDYNPVFNNKAKTDARWQEDLAERMKVNPDADKVVDGWANTKYATMAFEIANWFKDNGAKLDFIWMGSHKGEVNANAFVDRLARIAANVE